MNILNFIQRWAVVALIVAALLACLKMKQLETELIEARLDAANKQLDLSQAQRAADARVRKAEQAVTDKYQGALNASLKREALHRLELDGLRRVNDGLRDQNAYAARRLAAAPPAAVLEYATALGVVFEDCRAAYGDMAAKAAGHASDVVTAHDAWPSFTPVKE